MPQKRGLCLDAPGLLCVPRARRLLQTLQSGTDSTSETAPWNDEQIDAMVRELHRRAAKKKGEKLITALSEVCASACAGLRECTRCWAA